MTKHATIPPQFNWPPQVVEHFGSRGYQPVKEADNVTHTILTPEESTVPDETRDILYSKLPIRFWVKTEQTETCWIWNGYRFSQNELRAYGGFWWQGRDRRVHRVVWSVLHGDIPAKMEVCHKCDNPPCFNPAHLFLGTTADNQLDKLRKGRQGARPYKALIGEDNLAAKLTSEQVREIKLKLANGVSARGLAKQYNVASSTIDRIKNGFRWSHITIDSDTGGKGSSI